MDPASARKGTRGLGRADALREGGRYELSDGHSIYCAPTGGDGARGAGLGFEVLDTDPDAESAGVDAGFSPEPGMLRAPDVAVGNVPNARGWINGVPPLAVEYASSGQDEDDLQAKIGEFLARGTAHVWVVRLLGPRRVEVYEANKPMRTLLPGERLAAPGVLRNEVPVEALYDREAAHAVALRNLLQRRGYSGLEEVHEEGREEGLERGLEQGRLAGLASAILSFLDARGVELKAEERLRISSCRDSSTLESWLRRAARATRSGDVLD